MRVGMAERGGAGAGMGGCEHHRCEHHGFGVERGQATGATMRVRVGSTNSDVCSVPGCGGWGFRRW